MIIYNPNNFPYLPQSVHTFKRRDIFPLWSTTYLVLFPVACFSNLICQQNKLTGCMTSILLISLRLTCKVNSLQAKKGKYIRQKKLVFLRFGGTLQSFIFLFLGIIHFHIARIALEALF